MTDMTNVSNMQIWHWYPKVFCSVRVFPKLNKRDNEYVC